MVNALPNSEPAAHVPVPPSRATAVPPVAACVISDGMVFGLASAAPSARS
jgi:hypothetical protein